MKKYILTGFVLTFFVFFCNNTNAQLVYKVDYRMIMDNLEDSMPYAKDRTVSGILLTPHLGFSMNNHSLIVGVSVHEMFGTEKLIDFYSLRAYYEYDDSKFKAIAGIYSIYDREPLPLSYYTSSVTFLNDKAQGIYGQYKEDSGYIEAWVDWNKSDIKNGVDRFMVAVSGLRWWDAFRLRGIFTYKHLADKPVFETFNVFDRVQYDLNFGYDFARHQKVLDEILFTVGVAGDADRARNNADKGLEHGIGFQTEQLLRWNGFILHNTFYYGTPQMRYFEEYPFIYTGSAFYQAKWHDTLVAKYVYNYKWLTVSACFVFFVLPETVATQQLLTVSFSLDNIVNFKK